MSEAWSEELKKAQRLLSELRDEGHNVSAVQQTIRRGRIQQLRSIVNRLQRGHGNRQSEVEDLLHELNEMDNASSNESESTDRFGGYIQSQERSLGRLHTSIVGLRHVGSEISAEIEAQVRLLSDVEGQQQHLIDKHESVQQKFKSLNAASSSLCAMYVMIIILVIVIYLNIVGLSNRCVSKSIFRSQLFEVGLITTTIFTS